MINFNLSFFFNKKKSLLDSKDYQLNLKRTADISNSLNYDNDILQSFTENYQAKIKKLKKNFFPKNNKKKVVIGLGGSSSGAKAISYYISDDIIYFDNLDYSYLNNFLKNAPLDKYIFFVISKSGETFETLAIFNLIIQHAEKIGYDNILKNIVVITEDKNSFLHNFVKKNNIKFFAHNPKIGGRFSILSEAGMLPFIDLDVNVSEIGQKYLGLLKDYENDMSPVKNSAIILTAMKQWNLNMYTNLLYNYRLKHFSYWFHQLHAESLGKNKSGLTPNTSICPKDHHSMMQLYLDGPCDKFFNIFSPQDEIYFESFANLGFSNIEKYTPSKLLNKQYASVIEVFKEKNIPHRVIDITDHNNPSNIIELFSYFLLETIILGEALGINPYDQPAVQLIKNKI